MGNIFLVQPGILKSYITEDYLGRIDPALLKPYLALRSDWGQFELDGGSEDVSDIRTGTLGNRFARVSVMMKELDGLKQEGLRFGEGMSIGMPSLPNVTVPSGFAASFAFRG